MFRLFCHSVTMSRAFRDKMRALAKERYKDIPVEEYVPALQAQFWSAQYNHSDWGEVLALPAPFLADRVYLEQVHGLLKRTDQVPLHEKFKQSEKVCFFADVDCKNFDARYYHDYLNFYERVCLSFMEKRLPDDIERIDLQAFLIFGTDEADVNRLHGKFSLHILFPQLIVDKEDLKKLGSEFWLWVKSAPGAPQHMHEDRGQDLKVYNNCSLRLPLCYTIQGDGSRVRKLKLLKGFVLYNKEDSEHDDLLQQLKLREWLSPGQHKEFREGEYIAWYRLKYKDSREVLENLPLKWFFINRLEGSFPTELKPFVESSRDSVVIRHEPTDEYVQFAEKIRLFRDTLEGGDWFHRYGQELQDACLRKDHDSVVNILNLFYCIDNSTGSILRYNENHETGELYDELHLSAFMTIMEPFYIEFVSNGKPKETNAGKVWLRNMKRNTASRVVFAPPFSSMYDIAKRSKTIDTICNLWNDFRIPKSAARPLIPDTQMAVWMFNFEKRLYEEMCNPTNNTHVRFAFLMFMGHLHFVLGREDWNMTSYLLKWMATILQFPGYLTKILVILYSKEQRTGKGSVAAALMKIIGDIYSTRVRPHDIMGGRFNSIIANKLFLMGDEFGDDKKIDQHQGYNRLKELITEDKMVTEAKFKNPRMAYNCSNIMICSNDAACIAISPEDQRVLNIPLLVSNLPNFRTVARRKYFKFVRSLMAEEEGDSVGLKMFARFLYSIDLDQFSAEVIPHNPESQRIRMMQARESDNPYVKFVREAVERGYHADKIQLKNGSYGIHGDTAFGPQLAWQTEMSPEGRRNGGLPLFAYPTSRWALLIDDENLQDAYLRFSRERNVTRTELRNRLFDAGFLRTTQKVSFNYNGEVTKLLQVAPLLTLAKDYDINIERDEEDDTEAVETEEESMGGSTWWLPRLLEKFSCPQADRDRIMALFMSV